MTKIPANIAILIILGVALACITVLAALHVVVPDVLTTVALVAAGGGAGLSLPAAPVTAQNPVNPPAAPIVQYMLPEPTTAPGSPAVAVPAPAPVTDATFAASPAPTVTSAGGVTSTYPAAQ
jgi:hypothetical protein